MASERGTLSARLWTFYRAHLRQTPIGSVLRAGRRTLLTILAIPHAAAKPISEAIEKRITDIRDLRYRAAYVRRYYWPHLRHAVGWLRHSREKENFTYQITPRNKLHLASYFSVATGRSTEELRNYMTELENDTDLRAAIVGKARALPRGMNVDHTARFGRRVGWYVLVRALKPRVVVETGVDKGLGAAVICAALHRNALEGRLGRYFGTDINPAAGSLLTDPYARYGTILYGDSIESLKNLHQEIDLFINDSDHTPGYEKQEYLTVLPMLSRDAFIIGDNAHATDELLQFSTETGRAFLFWREEPQDHWYLGAGIGLSFPHRSRG